MSARSPQRKPVARPMRKPVAGTPVWVMPAAVIAGLALIVGIFLVYRYYTTPPPPPPASQDTTSQVVSIVTTLPASQLDSVGQGTANNPIQPVSGTPLTGPGGKKEVFYYGAEFCPYCAAQRWPLVIALSRFGTFSALQLTSSSSSDVYPNTPTFTFRKATFTSQYVDFVAVETTDRDRNPLQSPTAAQQQVVSRFDPAGTIPFIDFGNQYASTGSGYSPSTLQGMSWLAVADALRQPDSTQARAILGAANLITAAICKMTGDQPSAVCSSATIQNLEKSLK